MLDFTDRSLLTEMFQEFAKNNVCSECSENLIHFLSDNGMLNEKRVKECIAERRKNVKCEKIVSSMFRHSAYSVAEETLRNGCAGCGYTE